jgi:hypothetical protein
MHLALLAASNIAADLAALFAAVATAAHQLVEW